MGLFWLTAPAWFYVPLPTKYSISIQTRTSCSLGTSKIFPLQNTSICPHQTFLAFVGKCWCSWRAKLSKASFKACPTKRFSFTNWRIELQQKIEGQKTMRRPKIICKILDFSKWVSPCLVIIEPLPTLVLLWVVVVAQLVSLSLTAEDIHG